MLSSYTTGTKGHFRASGKEFMIVATTSTTSTIRYRRELDTPRNRHEIPDKDIREWADDGWPSDEVKANV
jgi:hypothetical protein